VRDEITGVYSEAYFMAMLAQEKARAQRGQGTFCVGVVGVDGFDLLIDYYGAAAGEMVLRHVGAAIAVELRNADAVGRYGDEEFAFVLFHTGLTNASIPAERVRRRISALDVVGLRPSRKISVSIGLAEFKPGEEIAALLKRAASARDAVAKTA
jgi:diguanylate cyclase (GGDEF)-like protein